MNADEYDQGFLSNTKQGVLYILYSGKDLYYIGKASQQGWRRMLQHQNNRHSQNWDRFLLLGIKRKYLTALESLLIYLVDPPGNRAKNRVPLQRPTPVKS